MRVSYNKCEHCGAPLKEANTMTNEKLIKTLRWCGSEDERHEMCVDESYRCPMWNEDRMTDYCKADLMLAAADALEAADKRIAELEKQDSVEMHKKQVARIAELEAQMPKEGEWEWLSSTYDRVPREMRYWCSVCHHEEITHDDKPWKHYCPNCGARMKGEHDGEQTESVR